MAADATADLWQGVAGRADRRAARLVRRPSPVPAATTADPTASRPSISTPMLSGQPASTLVY
ncbi:hypothetical protein HX744_15230 [Pseudonocardia sp. ICBG1122]|nr:hypothetical protein WY02_18395 [Pseudonocardia sp. AL041005-10]NWJ71851.1 hypothetical protein [Pseudonocardia pini]